MNDERFIVTGARRNSAEFSMDNLAACYQAVLCELDFGKEKIIRQYVERQPECGIYPNEYTLSFRGGTIKDGSFFTCTHSEILEVDLEDFTVRHRITDRLFNDLHHVELLNDELWFASTGLDAVGVFRDCEAEMYPSIGEEVFRPLEPTTDYRRISTKPHLSHPNYLFQIDGETWVTRFEQKDAISLHEPGRKMAIEVERPHDGVVVDGKVYFTTVNGSIVVFDSRTLKRQDIHDLQSLYRQPRIGWCRGISIEGDYAYVGFTRLRRTRSAEKLGFITDRWVNLKEAVSNVPPARIVKYDLKRRRIIKEMRLKNSELGVVFSLRRLN